MLDNNIILSKKVILITGAAGFIGSNLVMELLRTIPAIHIVGLDNMNDYYDVSLKEYRLAEIEMLASKHTDCSWEFIKGDITDRALIDNLFAEKHFSVANLTDQRQDSYYLI